MVTAEIAAKVAAKVRRDTHYNYKKVGLSGSPFYVFPICFAKGLLTQDIFAKTIL